MDLKAGKVYATITHKRNKNKQESSKPKFSFSAIVSGFLISTTIFSTAVAMPAYAADTGRWVSTGGIRIEGTMENIPSHQFTIKDDGSFYYQKSYTYREKLTEAVELTDQFRDLIKQKKFDLLTVKQTLDILKEAEQNFNSQSSELTESDCTDLNYIISTYGDTSLEAIPTYNLGVEESRADLVSALVITAKNFLQENGGKEVTISDIPVVQSQDTGIHIGSMNNFKVSTNGVRQYPDVPQDAWYFEEVTQSSSLGIIVGDDAGNFNPTDNLSYAEALTLAARVNAIYYGRQAEAEEMAATQKASGSHWAKGYEDYAYKYGVLDINSYGKRNLDADCSRYVMAELFAKALPTHEYNTINSWSKSPNLNEKNPNVKQLFLSGIMIGDENGFRGSDPITRAEAACIINRVAVKSNRQQIKTTGHGSGGFVAPEENPPVVDTQFNYDEYNNKAIVDYLTTLRSDPEYGHGAPPAVNHSPAARLIHIGAMEAAGIKQGGTKTYTLEEVSAGDMVRIVGGPYADSYTTVLVLERKENSIVVIEFNLNGMIHYGNEFTFSELAQCSEVKVQRLY